MLHKVINMKHFYMLFAICVCSPLAIAQESKTLFDGESLDAFVFDPGGWVIDDAGAMTCTIQEVKDKKGKTRQKGRGYIWTKTSYGDFSLALSYKLSTGCNSGVFFRTDKDNPVQGGFEVQLLDNEGFQKIKGKKDAKNLNGAFYDCQAASKDSAKPIGEWNDMKITVQDMQLTIEINGVVVNQADISKWDTPNKNPDGSANKFKTALNKLPRAGRIGFQNHGDVVWFKNIVISQP